MGFWYISERWTDGRSVRDDEPTDVGRIFYRIIRGPAATLDDFKSSMAVGKPLRDSALEREWREGVSVYDSLAYAVERARAVGFRLGRHVAPIRAPDDGSIEVRQTGKNRRHYTIYGPPEHLITLLDGHVVHVTEE